MKRNGIQSNYLNDVAKHLKISPQTLRVILRTLYPDRSTRHKESNITGLRRWGELSPAKIEKVTELLKVRRERARGSISSEEKARRLAYWSSPEGLKVKEVKDNKFKEYRRRWQRENKLSIKRGGERKHVKVKKKPYPETCQLCGVNNHGKIRSLHWHHWDDDRPELGLWLCQWCHWFSEGVDHGCTEDYVMKYLELRKEVEGEVPSNT